MAKYKIKYDKTKCIGAGSCAQICPESWSLDSEGLAVQKKKEITEKELDLNVKAAKSCPAHAIEVYDERGKKIV